MTAHDNRTKKRYHPNGDFEHGGQLSSTYGRFWKKLLSTMTHQSSSGRQSKAFLSPASRKRAGIGSSRGYGLGHAFHFNYFNLTFCIILHERNNFYLKRPKSLTWDLQTNATAWPSNWPRVKKAQKH